MRSTVDEYAIHEISGKFRVDLTIPSRRKERCFNTWLDENRENGI